MTISLDLLDDADGLNLSGTQRVRVTASPGGGLQKIEVYRNGALVASGTSSPLTWSWDTTKVADGTYKLTATAFYKTRKSSVGPIVVTVNNTVTPPPPPPPPTSAIPFKGCSTGSKILGAPDGISWEIPEVAACFGSGSLIRIDTGNDAVVQAALDVGLKILLVIGGTISSSTTPTAHATATTTSVTRWKGKLWGVEVGGNEPNVNGQTASGNAALVKAGYAAAKVADPNVIVCAGSCAPADNFLSFLTAFIPLAKGNFDHLAPHLYEDANVRGAWNNWDRCFHPETMSPTLTVRQVLDNNGLQNTPISSGESGGHVATVADEATQNTYVQHAYADFAARRARGEKVGFITIFCMRNDENAAGWGLCRTDHTRRPAWFSAQAATA